MSNTPKVSVIIPTLNRPEIVLALVKDLLQEDYPDYEIVVVDSSAVVNTALQSMVAEHPKKVQYHHVEAKGTCHSRNVGVEHANGSIFLFLDDDTEVRDPLLLQKHVVNYADPEIGGVGGRVEDRNTQLNKEQSGRACWVDETGRVYANATGHERVEINAPRGGHMSFRAEAVHQAGGFDTQFVGNAMREETDFSLRVVKAGWKLVFDPTVTVVHLAYHSGGSRNAQRRQWYEDFFANEFYFMLKHFSRWQLPHFFLRKLRAILSCMFYYGKGHPDWLLTPYWGFRAGLRRYGMLKHKHENPPHHMA
ncbi:MAG: glycosyltransferase [Candidatus Nomurabacteria bacterium]|nr:MAG: glycosyltransferase [Candidatus Nomurabacteria bacterium]